MLRNELKSPLLLAYVSNKDEMEGGLFPSRIEESIREFDQLIQWKRVPGTDKDIPEPQPGIDEAYD